MNPSETKIQNFTWAVWKEDGFLDFLKTMAAEGWILCGYKRQSILMMWKPYGYIFQRADPQELEFRIDYRSIRKQEQGTYFQLCEDAGWHHAITTNGLHVFFADSKTAARADFFSDSQSKIAKYRRIQKRTMILGVILIPALYYLYYYSWFSQHIFVFRDAVFAASMIVLITVFYFYILFQLQLRIHKIKNQQNAEKPVNTKKKWRLWYDVVLVIGLTLALTPFFGFALIPDFRWSWGWYFQNAFFVSIWSSSMVAAFAWMVRRGKQQAQKLLAEK